MDWNEAPGVAIGENVHPFWLSADGIPEDIHCMRTLIANVAMIEMDDGWVLVDAGVHGHADEIVDAAQKRFGNSPPKAILLTHGHFDHVGCLPELLDLWPVPVYAHPLELPYLTGKQDYPPAHPDAGGGLMAFLSPLYPRKACDFTDFLEPYPDNGVVPYLPEFHWIHTPGHTPGHVSFFRGRDKTVISGDCFITVKQESAWSVLIQDQVVHGPPAYFTMDWDSAQASIKKLASLRPEYAVTGHGFPMSGSTLRHGLETLAAGLDSDHRPPSSPVLH